MSEKGLEPLANLRETLWLLARALGLRTSDWRILLLEGDNTHTHIHSYFFYHLQSATRGAQIREWTVFWCFLLADLSVGVQTGARAPLCPLFCRNSQEISGKESLADG